MYGYKIKKELSIAFFKLFLFAVILKDFLSCISSHIFKCISIKRVDFSSALKFKEENEEE